MIEVIVHFPTLSVLHLSGNICLKELAEDPNLDLSTLQYPEYLLRVGEGRLEHGENITVEISPSVNAVGSASELIDTVFRELQVKYSDTKWLTSRAILSTKNSRLRALNDEVI